MSDATWETNSLANKFDMVLPSATTSYGSFTSLSEATMDAHEPCQHESQDPSIPSDQCMLLKIPTELRLHIYGHLFDSSTHLVWARRYDHNKVDLRFASNSPENKTSTALMMTCRTINDEATPEFWQRVHVRSSGLPMFPKGSLWMEKQMTMKTLMKHIRNVHFAVQIWGGTEGMDETQRFASELEAASNRVVVGDACIKGDWGNPTMTEVIRVIMMKDYMKTIIDRENINLADDTVMADVWLSIGDTIIQFFRKNKVLF